MKKSFQKIFKNPYFAYIPIFFIAILFIVMPLFSLSKQALTINDPYDYETTSVGLANFNKVFADKRFVTAVENTLWLLFLVSPLIMMLFFFIALAIAKLSFKLFKDTFIAIIFSQLFISIYSMGITFLVLFGPRTNVLNSIFQTNINWNDPNHRIYPFLQLTIFYTWTVSVISVLLFVIGINKINASQFLMAKIDKLSFFKQIVLIYIPALKRIIYLQIYIFVFQTLFFYPTIYENPFAVKAQTLSTYIINNLHFNSSPLNWSLAAAASIVLILMALGVVTLVIGSKLVIKIWTKRRRDVEL